ncbi:ABC transporter substrate-binding protein [Nocardioides insulae]|uniref:ABC transporter substrate-binding protein n=1 Tax=Nocardioides insulae TaxID=394734 RepID=UPI00041FF614|nr:ABC transporter substrate-binding protein [Nocardioides insulae]
MTFRPSRALAGAAALALPFALLAGCGGDEEDSGATGGAVSAERCSDNEAAGTITYLTGYHYQASASILEVMAAEDLGYFDDLCLDVEIQPGPGDTSQNAKLVASGQVQLTGLSQQDVISANANGLAITGISSYSNSGLDVLMTGTDVTELTQLDGATIGHKGWMPIAVQGMLEKAGVDYGSLKLVKVGYDPTVLTRGQVDGLTGFVSNEPNQLARAGEEITVWQPSDLDVPGSLGAFSANPDFLAEHPTAAQDFLRASFKAFQYCAEENNVEECIDIQGEYAGAESDPEHETDVWTTESEVAAEDPLPVRWGGIDTANVRQLATLITTYAGQQIAPADAVADFDPSVAEAVVDESGKVIWPAP